MRTQKDTVNHFPRKISLLTIGITALSLLAIPSHAQFLVNPTGGTDISGLFADPDTTVDPDDGSVVRSLGGTFTFYGTGITTIYAQADGFLSTTDGSGYLADRTVAALAGVIPASVIAPFYDDLFDAADEGNNVREKVVSGSYYSLTYSIDAYTSDFTGTQTNNFQTVLFTGNTTINGVSFLAGDIVFSYGALNAPVQASNFSVGIAQSTTNSTSPFGGNSQFATTGAFTSNFNPVTQGIRFRPTTTGGVTTYTQTLVPLSATPEPSQYAAFGLGILGIGALAIKARRRSVLA